jgi:hypothetical protein
MEVFQDSCCIRMKSAASAVEPAPSVQNPMSRNRFTMSGSLHRVDLAIHAAGNVCGRDFRRDHRHVSHILETNFEAKLFSRLRQMRPERQDSSPGVRFPMLYRPLG